MDNRCFFGDYYISDGCKPIEIKVSRPIEWIVLDRTADGKTLLLSRDVIDWDFYDCEDVTKWNETWIYECLNEMYENYFSEDEKKEIIDEGYGHLFLLSESEIRRYMKDDESRRAVAYFVNEKNDEIVTDIEHYFYWLRADDKATLSSVPYVQSTGEITSGYAEMDEIGIRPAMWVNTEPAGMLSAGKGYNKYHHSWDYSEF